MPDPKEGPEIGEGMDAIYLVTLVGTLLVLLAAFSSMLAYRFGAPLLLLFLGIGLAAGVDGLGIEFSNYRSAYFIGALALAVILFDSGFRTPFAVFREAAAPAMVLATAGVVLTSAFFAVGAHVLLSLEWVQSFLLGAIVASTDAAAVFFLLRVGGIHIRERVTATLEVESGTNDPMAIFLTIALVEAMSVTGETGGEAGGFGLELAAEFVREMGIGFLGGWLGGIMIGWLVSRFDMDRGLTPIFVLALSLLVFSATGALHGSGFLAVYVAGLYAGNRNVRGAAAIKRFQDGATWLAQIIMFLMLGLLATPSDFGPIAVPAVLLALFLCFVARPLAVWLSLLPFDLPRNESAFVAWVGLRGAVSILLAIVPLLAGIEGGTVYFNSAFIIVLVSLLLQGWSIGPLARRLGLAVPPQIGPVEKVELELPGTAHHELLVYRVVKDSPVARGESVPRWARPSLVIRDGQSTKYPYSGKLSEGDYVYLFIHSRYPRLLDRLFASPAPVDADDADFFGAFTIDATQPASSLHAIYGAELRPGEEELTIAQMMTARLGGNAEYADRVPVGPIDLIVRTVDENDAILEVGVLLEPEASRTKTPLYITGRELLRQIAALLRGRPPGGAAGTGDAAAP